MKLINIRSLYGPSDVAYVMWTIRHILSNLFRILDLLKSEKFFKPYDLIV